MSSNEQVVKAWSEGKSEEGKNMKTDGKDLYSYALKIGYTSCDFESGDCCCKRVFNYYISRTTSRHIALAAKYGTLVQIPKKI